MGEAPAAEGKAAVEEEEEVVVVVVVELREHVDAAWYQLAGGKSEPNLRRFSRPTNLQTTCPRNQDRE